MRYGLVDSIFMLINLRIKFFRHELLLSRNSATSLIRNLTTRPKMYFVSPVSRLTHKGSTALSAFTKLRGKKNSCLCRLKPCTFFFFILRDDVLNVIKRLFVNDRWP